MKRALEPSRGGVASGETIYVGAHPNDETRGPRVISVRLRIGESKTEKASETKPKYEIGKLSEILQLMGKL